MPEVNPSRRPYVPPQRNTITMLFSLGKKYLTEVIENIVNSKIFKVKIDDDSTYLRSIEKVENLLSNIFQKLSLIEVEDSSAENELKKVVGGIENSITESKTGAEKISESIHSSGYQVQNLLAETRDSLRTVVQEIKNLHGGLGVLKYEAPEVQQVKGSVDIVNFPKPYDFDKIVDRLSTVSSQFSNLEKVIGNIKIEIPEQKEVVIPEFPKQLSFIESKAMLQQLASIKEELSQIPKRLPVLDFPSSISVSNFPPQKYPLPVTSININSLRGPVKSTAITVSTSATALPTTPLTQRRSMILFNNSSQTLYLGGSDVTILNGLPIDAESFSPPMDIGDRVTLYGVVETSTANVRVFEASMDNIGA